MSADQPGSLPSYGQYDPQGYGNRGQQQLPVPDTVKYAFYLMLGGAALQAVGVVVTLTQMATIRNAIKDAQVKQNSTLTPSQIDTVVNVAIGAAVVLGLVYIGLWLWMAFMNRAGRNWARVTGSVFFGLDVLFTLIGLVTLVSGAGRTNSMSAGTTAASWSISFVTLLVGLATVLLLWNSRSSAYFARPTMQYTGYGQQPSPYGGQPSPYGPYGAVPPGAPPQAPPPPGTPPQTPPPAGPGYPPPNTGQAPGEPPAPGSGPSDFSPPA